MTEGQKPKTKGNYINGWSLISLATSGVIFVFCWCRRCKKKPCGCKKDVVEAKVVRLETA